MRFISLILGTLLALLVSEVFGLTIGSNSQYQSGSKIEQRASSSEWYLKQVPGSNTGEQYLTIDVLAVGYIEHTGNFKIHNYQSGKEAAQGKKDKALDVKSRRIGTNSLTICSLAMLISEKGALMAHLNPDFCTLFLDSTRTAAQKKEDEAGANYKAAKKSFDQFQSKCQKYYEEFSKLTGGKYEAVVVRGPNQNDSKYGLSMVQNLFNKNINPEVHYLERKSWILFKTCF